MAAFLRSWSMQSDEEVSKLQASQGAGDDNGQSWPSPVLAGRNEPEAEPETLPRLRRRRFYKNPAVVERTNLLNVSKLVIKELIDSSFCHGRMLDMDHVPLQQFFIIMEHILRHGLKSKKGILAQKKEYWNMLEQVERYMLDAAEITATVKELPEIKTPAGRGRAWLRLALMQKKLSDYFRCILERKEELLSEYYESYAFMMEDEGAIFSGLLVGLNIIDCNFCLKEEDLDYQLGVIDFSLYLKNSNKSDSFDGENEQSTEQPNMMALLDQKNYIEELNRHLNATVTNLQQKLESFTTSNALMKEDLAIAKNNILSLQEENQILQAERDSLLDENTRKLQKRKQKNMKQDLEVERETYTVSKEGLDSMYIDAAKQLEQELKLRKEVEKELELQTAMKSEMEVAMKLLEKDIHEKQDTMMSLRRQLEEIKNINLEMYKKLQECQGSLQHKTELVAKLEHKTNQMASTIRDMEARLKDGERGTGGERGTESAPGDVAMET